MIHRTKKTENNKIHSTRVICGIPKTGKNHGTTDLHYITEIQEENQITIYSNEQSIHHVVFGKLTPSYAYTTFIVSFVLSAAILYSLYTVLLFPLFYHVPKFALATHIYRMNRLLLLYNNNHLADWSTRLSNPLVDSLVDSYVDYLVGPIGNCLWPSGRPD